MKLRERAVLSTQKLSEPWQKSLFKQWKQPGWQNMVALQPAKSLLHQMNLTKRRGSIKSVIAPDDLEEVKKILFIRIVETMAMNDVPEDLIFNWDQTGINLILRVLIYQPENFRNTTDKFTMFKLWCIKIKKGN